MPMSSSAPMGAKPLTNKSLPDPLLPVIRTNLQAHRAAPSPSRDSRRTTYTKMPGPKSRPKTSYGGKTKSVTTLKKKIRDLQRLLSRPNSNLSAQLRVDNERALAAYKHELSFATQSRAEQKNAKKYHMVRFFGMCRGKRRWWDGADGRVREAKGYETVE
jgi:hypothetical protein